MYLYNDKGERLNGCLEHCQCSHCKRCIRLCKEISGGESFKDLS